MGRINNLNRGTLKPSFRLDRPSAVTSFKNLILHKHVCDLVNTLGKDLVADLQVAARLIGPSRLPEADDYLRYLSRAHWRRNDPFLLLQNDQTRPWYMMVQTANKCRSENWKTRTRPSLLIAPRFKSRDCSTAGSRISSEKQRQKIISIGSAGGSVHHKTHCTGRP